MKHKLNHVCTAREKERNLQKFRDQMQERMLYNDIKDMIDFYQCWIAEMKRDLRRKPHARQYPETYAKSCIKNYENKLTQEIARTLVHGPDTIFTEQDGPYIRRTK